MLRLPARRSARTHARLRDRRRAVQRTTLVRPAFVLLPFFFAIAVPLLVRSQRNRDGARPGWARARRRGRARPGAVVHL